MLSFENEEGRRGHAEYCLPKAEIKDYNVKINNRDFFANKQWHKNVRKILQNARDQGDDNTAEY